MSDLRANTIHTRRAGLVDVALLAPLFDGYRQFYGQPSQPDACAGFLRERLQRDESAIFIAERTGQAVGFVQLYPVFSSVRLRRTWLLNDLFVRDGERGNGIGRALLDAARDHGRAIGAACLVLETAQDNVGAQRLYARCGYRRLDPAQQFYQLDLADGP